MKPLRTCLIAAALAAASLSTAHAAVAVSVGEPGFFGSIDIGGGPPPTVINTAPVVVGAPVVNAPPMYMRVPPEHQHHWDRYCAQYNACGRPTYFVHEDWYRHHYHR